MYIYDWVCKLYPYIFLYSRFSTPRIGWALAVFIAFLWAKADAIRRNIYGRQTKFVILMKIPSGSEWEKENAHMRKLEEMCMEMGKKKKNMRSTQHAKELQEGARLSGVAGVWQGKGKGEGVAGGKGEAGGLRLQRQLAAHEIRNSKARNQYSVH